MLELTYNPNQVANDYELSLTVEDSYVWMNNPDGSLNETFLNILGGLESFRCVLTVGTATFRFERGSHWYAYKKVKGKLNKAYLGRSTDFTEQLLTDVVARVNIDKSDQPRKAIAKKVKADPISKQLESAKLAGHGKDLNLIQTSIPEVFPDNWNPEAEQWKNIAATYQRSCNMAWDEVKKLKEEIENLKGQAIQLDIGDGVYDMQRSIDSLEAENILLQSHLKQEKESYLILKGVTQQEKLDMQAAIDSQAKLIFSLRADIHDKDLELYELKERIQQLEWESSKREEQVNGYFFMHEELSDQVFKYRTVIEEFRHLAKGKDKRNHPRFAYLLDFLTAIDKLS